MPRHCIFFAPKISPACQILRALGIEDIPEHEERTVLHDRFCTTGKFTDCPLFQCAERGLAGKQLRLRRSTDLGAVSNDPASCSEALC